MLPISMVVLHYTGMQTAQEAFDRLTDAQARVSAHYCIDEDGTVTSLVPEAKRAWHAGKSYWRGITDVNSASIGIELVNPGHEFGYRPFPRSQMIAVEGLCRDILRHHPIPARHVLGHSDVAPQRKSDPGERFDWPRLARLGIGLWPDFADAVEAPETIADTQRLLAAIGYETPQSGVADEATTKVLAAFQRHFRPARCDGGADAETGARIAAVAAACQV